VVFWGTYDTGNPRVRLLIDGARAAGLEVVECHGAVWEGVTDKSQLKGLVAKLRRLVRWLGLYPSLIWRYWFLPRHDAVIVAYLGQLDVLVLRPFAWLRGVPVLWDAFLSLYDTAVEDRRLVSQRSLAGRALFALEWCACRAATKLFLDTRAHATYFERTFGLAVGSVERVWVGAETQVFQPSEREVPRKGDSPFTALFYGQFTPLHGLETIVRAAAMVEKSGVEVRWVLVGRGQEEKRIEALIRELDVQSIERVAWVEYPKLIDWINRADVCLGIFGTSGKASRVIPNKVFQILAAGRPLITADTPAIRELLDEGPMVRLVPAGDPERLAAAVRRMAAEGPCTAKDTGRSQRLPVVGAQEVGEQLRDIVDRLWGSSSTMRADAASKADDRKVGLHE
jgi:glycosyltransferase involved in cell wall biosynthesis